MTKDIENKIDNKEGWMITSMDSLNGLINNKIEESFTLEYKKEFSKKGMAETICKDICAFANSDGGTIICGIEDKKRIPIKICWIEDKQTEEGIHDTINNSIYPKLKGVKVNRFLNPNNNKEAIFEIKVLKSFFAPHMYNNRYYKRSGSISSPMNHDEIKNAMFGVGRNIALQFEIFTNLKLAGEIHRSITAIDKISLNKRKYIALPPFHTNAWTAIIASGLLFAFPAKIIEKLIETYAIIHEINSLIDWLKIEKTAIVHTIDKNTQHEDGTWIPSIIQKKLPINKLTDLLKEIKELN